MKNKILILFVFLITYTFAQNPDTTNPYVRKPKKGGVSLELGANSLASLLGIKGTFYVNPRLPIDIGLGLSGVGLRPGVQARYLFSDAKFSGFGLVGLKYGLGSGGTEFDLEDPDTKVKYLISTKPSPFLDLGVGFDYQAHSGFSFIGTIGWSTLLSGENVEWSKQNPTPSKKAEEIAKFAFGSGPMLALSLGYAF